MTPPAKILVPVAAGLCLAGAAATGVFAALGNGAMALAIQGGSSFAIDPQRAAVLAPLLLAAAACGLASQRPGIGWFGLVVAAVASILAAGPFTAVFWFLIAAVIVVLRRGGAFALAALPASGVMLMLHQAPPALVPWCALAGGVLLLASAAGAVRTATCSGLARASAIGFTGLALTALGFGSDAAAVAAIAANAVIAPIPGLVGGTLIEATGTDGLDWLGGIARGMPRFAVLALAGLWFASALPPSPGFAAFIATWTAAIAGGSTVAAIILAAWFGAMGFALLRAIGALCLGRPRSLRAAAAEDAPRPVLVGLALLVAGGGVMAAAHPALLALAGTMAAIALAVARFLRRGGPIEVAAYDGGFARPPAWLPFGDPATQITATGFAATPRHLAVPPVIVRAIDRFRP